MGTLLGTPRIIQDDDDDPNAPSSSRPSNPFNIAHPSNRDSIGRKLGVQASRSLRERAALLSTGVVGSSGATPGGVRKRKPASTDMLPPTFTPRRGGAGSADLLSPAARTLLGRTKSGSAMGLTPTPKQSGSLTPVPGSLKNKGRGGVDLRKVGWSPMATPVSHSTRRGNR